MPSLAKYLSSIDHDLLTRIARHWEIEVESADWKTIETKLFAGMTDKTSVEESIGLLPPATRKAWEAVLAKANRFPWSEFIIKYGNLREFGPAARQRESPDQQPANTTEVLYYRGLIGRAFMDATPEPREFAFVADEVAALFNNAIERSPLADIRPVPPAEIKRHQSANTRLLDHVVDWLANLRMGKRMENEYFLKAEIAPQFITAMAGSANLVTSGFDIAQDKIAFFLQSERLISIKDWFQQWKTSSAINDLLMTPGLEFEGTWRNDPVFSRQAVLEQLTTFDVQTWYSLTSFIGRIKTEYPDFMRPAGDFDSWSIRMSGKREYLTGREHWDDVEGAYLRYLFAGPLHWLGIVDLAYGSTDTAPIAFRISPIANYLLNIEVSAPVLAAETSLKLLSDLTIVMPINSSRLLRYQVGRFTKIINNSVSETRFQISAESLTTAEKNGLKIEQLLQLLEKQGKTPLPASYKKLAERWDQRRVEVKIEKATLLRIEDPQVLKLLNDNPRTARLIKETLTEKIVIIEPAGMELVKKVLLEAGILSQIELDV